MENIKKLYMKYKEIINYLIFGVLTTLVNIVTYFIFARMLHIEEITSNIIAWIVSVLFAYITNKIYVFESKKVGLVEITKEIFSFFACRLLSGIIDIGLFALMIKVMFVNDGIAKIITQILVIIINYILSKLIVFRKSKEEK